MKRNLYLGIDIGSISAATALIDKDGNVLQSFYDFHRGDIAGTLKKRLSDTDFSLVKNVAVTSGNTSVFRNHSIFDTRIAFIRAARFFHEDLRSLLIIGGEKFGLVTFDQEGSYLNYRSNSSCAAGTGSFLDQQAKRLNLSSIEEFCHTAAENNGPVPKIASRCAVFAKTDLIHCQQEGYSLFEICDGLCHGLAKNVADTLFSSEKIPVPAVLAGGVSKNGPVIKHLSNLTNTSFIIDEHSHLYGPVGAALLAMEAPREGEGPEYRTFDDIIIQSRKGRSYYYPPLELKMSSYPDFESFKRYEYISTYHPKATPVEVDLYMAPETGHKYSFFLGIDIGSTSTKAVLTNNEGDVFAGFYTRTSGRPLEAVQAVFEAVSDIETSHNITIEINGAGTTGSGRKFIGEIIGSDLILDEISAHARAASHLDPEVDTIIEIGGQDAKFTTMKNGMVTLSVMNNVCAAGTGSFIEEQAGKLGCPLGEYSRRAQGTQAPLASDRCTVFMERDLNHYLNENYQVDEILASVLHSVRENYLSKVAVEAAIGEKIFFQGATAKNRALVAAFEQGLGKPIMVSKFCHLTGALGTALSLSDSRRENTAFRGFSLFREEIPVRSEVCDLCANHCKLKIAEVGGQTVAFGFLCGRDYEEKAFVKTGGGHNGIKERAKALSFKKCAVSDEVTVGLPYALHLVEEFEMWERFFNYLSIKTVNSRNYSEAIREGKKISGAEFCAPMASLHGHVKHLLGRANWVFLPNYLEAPRDISGGRRQYCYYTQYAPSVISSILDDSESDRIASPLLRSIKGNFFQKSELFKMLKKICPGRFSFLQVSGAYDRVVSAHRKALKEMRDDASTRNNTGDIEVVLLGRPYNVLPSSMNSGIPGIFERLNIKTLSGDMLPVNSETAEELAPLLKALHWNYGANILKQARTAASRPGTYPVLITSFKCAPDSIVIDYFRDIMESHEKPYLILQLDEHDSSVGYETRVEAGIRSFRNHYSKSGKEPAHKTMAMPQNISGTDSLRDKTLLLPNWDSLTNRLLTANLRGAGIDARLLEETGETINRSMGLNNGQCIPLNAIVQGAADYIESHNLDPAKTVLWSVESTMSCNLGMYSYFKKTMLEKMGGGLEKVDVYRGELTFIDINMKRALNSYYAYMFGGLIKKMGCKIRPYETVPGKTDETIEGAVAILEDVFENDRSKEEAIRNITAMFKAIPVREEQRPKAALFGDLYARDNSVMNQDLIRFIEQHGGEVITTPYSELAKIIAEPYLKRWRMEGMYKDVIIISILNNILQRMETRYYKFFNEVLKEELPETPENYERIMDNLGLSVLHTGESMENLLKIVSLVKHYPDLSFFVQTNPAYCCPSLVTEAMASRIEEYTGVPIVTIEYDGTGSFKNDDVIPYLKFPRKKRNIKRKLAI